MKFVLAFVALALVATVNAMPTTVFAGLGMTGVEDAQVAARKIGFADADLEVLEGKLAALELASSDIVAAATVQTEAMDKTEYPGSDAFLH